MSALSLDEKVEFYYKLKETIEYQINLLTPNYKLQESFPFSFASFAVESITKIHSSKNAGCIRIIDISSGESILGMILLEKCSFVEEVVCIDPNIQESSTGKIKKIKSTIQNISPPMC
jgi:hypothetical protein